VSSPPTPAPLTTACPPSLPRPATCSHPLPQVVSAKVFADPLDTFPQRVNSLLPGQIRVLGVTRVTEGFTARMYCDKRRWQGRREDVGPGA
jgi:hypothetical protein